MPAASKKKSAAKRKARSTSPARKPKKSIEKKSAKKRTRSSSPSKKKKSTKKSAKVRVSVRRALSAYNYYWQYIYPKVAKRHPDKKATQLSKVIGKMWKKLDDASLKKFEAMAAKDKKRSANERAAIKKKRSRKSKGYDGGPSKNKFLEFAKGARAEYQREHPDASFAEISKKVGEMWQAQKAYGGDHQEMWEEEEGEYDGKSSKRGRKKKSEMDWDDDCDDDGYDGHKHKRGRKKSMESDEEDW